MTKAELVRIVASAAKVSDKVAGEVLDVIFRNMAKSLREDKRFEVPRFGTFSVRARKPKEVRNPQTGAIIHIDATRTVGFKAAPSLKKML
jgi:DNA-binding protein HU-beta